MNPTSIKALFFGCYVATFTLAVPQARATLGESADTVQPERKDSSAVRHTTLSRNGYTVREVASGANVLREYISPSGVVFAIAWNGVSHPDLTSQLGTYAGEYQKALRKTTGQKGKRHMQVKAERVIVEKWGHMRNMQGRAYIPALLPSGVRIDEIK
jgi:hypothetical protein